MSKISTATSVPEDLVQDAIALAEELDEVRAADGSAPAWATAAAERVRGKATDAERETDEAAAADSAHNEQLATVRAAKALFDAELSNLRATLRAVLGRSHPDFQKLRNRKAATPDVEDDPSAPPPSGPVTPVPAPV